MVGDPRQQADRRLQRHPIAASGTVAQIKVGVDIEHPYIGDLRVALHSPAGRRAVLHAQLGGSTDNLVATYDSASPGRARRHGGPVDEGRLGAQRLRPRRAGRRRLRTGASN